MEEVPLNEAPAPPVVPPTQQLQLQRVRPPLQDQEGTERAPRCLPKRLWAGQEAREGVEAEDGSGREIRAATSVKGGNATSEAPAAQRNASEPPKGSQKARALPLQQVREGIAVGGEEAGPPAALQALNSYHLALET